MATIREKVEAMGKYAEDFREYAGVNKNGW